MLTDSQIERYSRQIILAEIGGRGQETLLHSAVLVVGDGGLAEVATTYLAAAGVGRLTAASHCVTALAHLNSDCRTAVHQWWSATAVERETMVRSHDVVIDAGGPSESSDALNVACIQSQRPLLWGRASDAVATVTMFAGHLAGQPCYSCMPVPDATVGANAVGFADLSARFLGGLVAIEAVKAILSIGTLLSARMLVYSPLRSTVSEAPVVKNPECVTCGRGARVANGRTE